MDARILRAAVLAVATTSLGAGYRTPNFIIQAPTSAMAQQIGRAAEKFRQELALEWLGEELPQWSQPCPISAQVGERLGAGGATSFLFERGEVYGWKMNIQGSLERILDSVLPHEVTHTIFATHFRRPLPRWADEGACTTVEHASERAKQQTMLVSFLKTDRGIPFNRMFAMKEYPRDVMPLYSQGYSVARFLIAQGGRRKFVDYLSDGLRDNNWNRATRECYGYESLGQLQYRWLAWVREGSPRLRGGAPAPRSEPQVALASARRRDESGVVYRGQSQDDAGRTSVYAARSRPRGDVEGRPGSDEASWSAVRSRPRTEPRAPRRASVQPPDDQAAPGPAGDRVADLPEPDPLPPVQESPTQSPRGKPRQLILEWTRPVDEPIELMATSGRNSNG